MPGRIGIDPPSAVAVTSIEQRGAELQDLFLSLIEILGRQIKVELLRVGGVWPPRGLMVSHALEGEHEPGAGVEGRPVIID
jgi:hypothetical protein